MSWFKRMIKKVQYSIEEAYDWIREYEKAILITLASLAGAALICFLIFGVACRGFSTDPEAIKLGVNSQTLMTMDYQDVEEVLRDKGFTNIRLEDSKAWFLVESGDVWQISIDGQKNFYKFSKFSKDDLVIIYYYR